MITRLDHPEAARSLFADWQETLIWSALDGIMGEVYANDSLTSALICSGDFGFYGGVPSEELARFHPDEGGRDFFIAVPQNAGWEPLLERSFGGQASKTVRYAFYKDPAAFDPEMLWRYAQSLPEGYVLRAIDETLYEACLRQTWSRDLVSQYRDFATYRRLGLGVGALYGEEIVSGASSYGTYPGGIEIEIDTRIDQRRKGLATACAAALILRCLERGLYPSWDAQNLWSVGLAKKLGYRLSHEYVAYEIKR